MIFDGFDFSGLKTHTGWLILIYVAVLIAMVVDLITGIRKAKLAGVATTSKGLKKTCDKAIKYFFPMLCLTCIDLIASNFLPLPVMTALMGVFNILCEFKSVMEKTHEKDEIRKAEKTMSIVLENKDELAHMIATLIKEYSEKGSSEDASDKK